MIEVTLALIALVAVGVIGFIGTAVTPGLIAAIGVGALLLGLGIGVPTGFWYHVILYRCVSAKIALPPEVVAVSGRLHRHLTAAEAKRISPWNRIGGFGFVLCLLGGLAAIAGLLLGR